MTFLLNTRRAFFIVSVTIVSSCNKNMFKPGEYTNHEGQHLMLRADSVFEFFYYSYNNMIYSSGKFTVNDNKIHIISDSANFPIIEKVITEKNDRTGFIINDDGYAIASQGSISYDVIINDSLTFEIKSGNKELIDREIHVNKIKIAINTTTRNDVYGPPHNSPIYSNSFIVTNLKNGHNLFLIKIKLDTRMFYTQFFDEYLKIKKQHIIFPGRFKFYLCPTCTWNKNTMTSPALDK